MTAGNVIGAAIFGRLPFKSVLEFVGFASVIVGMGFICGTVVWVGQTLPKRLGRLGDALLGSIVLTVFFLCCMLIFARDLLWDRLRVGGMPMLSLGLVAGALSGLWCGHIVRRENAAKVDSLDH